jgi:hypothetical protein
MAENGEEEKLVILVANVGKGSNANDDLRLTAVSDFFATTLTETPDIVFAQEVRPDDQISTVVQQLKRGRENVRYTFRKIAVYSNSFVVLFWKFSETDESTNQRINGTNWLKDNFFINQVREGTLSPTERNKRLKRFRMCKLTRDGRSILLVNFHGKRDHSNHTC